MKPKAHKSLSAISARQRKRAESLDEFKHVHDCHRELKKPDSDSSNESEEDEEDIDIVSHVFRGKCSVRSSSPGCQWTSSSSGGGPSSTSKLKNTDQIETDRDKDKEWRRMLTDYDELFQSVREKREQLVERLRIYNSLLKFHKSVKEDQVYLYRKLQDIDELYLRNTAAILRLGFCPCLVHQQTSSVGDRLMKIHRKLRLWDRKMEEICDVVKVEEPTTRKAATVILQIMKACEPSKIEQMQAELDDIALPDVVWDLENTFIETLDVSKLADDWKNVRNEVRDGLGKVESKFQEVCLEFGVTKGPAANPSANKSFFFRYSDDEENGVPDYPDLLKQGSNGEEDNDNCPELNNSSCTEVSSFL